MAPSDVMVLMELSLWGSCSFVSHPQPEPWSEELILEKAAAVAPAQSMEFMKSGAWKERVEGECGLLTHKQADTLSLTRMLPLACVSHSRAASTPLHIDNLFVPTLALLPTLWPHLQVWGF